MACAQPQQGVLHYHVPPIITFYMKCPMLQNFMYHSPCFLTVHHNLHKLHKKRYNHRTRHAVMTAQPITKQGLGNCTIFSLPDPTRQWQRALGTHAQLCIAMQSPMWTLQIKLLNHPHIYTFALLSCINHYHKKEHGMYLSSECLLPSFFSITL